MENDFCITVMDSGNYTMNLNRILKQKGYDFDTMATPSRISQGNCGLSIQFPYEYAQKIIDIGREYSLPVKKIFRIHSMGNQVGYERIY